MWPFKKTIKNYPESFPSECAGIVTFRDAMENYPIPGTDEVVDIRKFGYLGMSESLNAEVFFVPPEKGSVELEKWVEELDARLAHVQQNLDGLLAAAAVQVDSLRHEGEFMGEFKVEESADVREHITVDSVKVVSGGICCLLCTVFVCEGRSIGVEVSFNMQFDFLRAEIIGGGYIFG